MQTPAGPRPHPSGDHLSGPRVRRLYESVNFGVEDSVNYFHRSLRKMGAIDALREAGATEGDTIELEGMGGREKLKDYDVQSILLFPGD